ncbi:MAG: acetoacetate--CoA ligase [Bdellovibrionales bacterium]|jgi:acetoacetyl-CoA synthetase|nr:acetoacetate--CoA ligase [Bdellovibrionales bacterium]MBT3525823.1 acetoacetate--CoA ligase [Bdellovibrionales bacterium]MBT7669910.1 acetoacetate--CoA ligase [Bdellovibrionales bacterium]
MVKQLWEASTERKEQSQMFRFMETVKQKYQVELPEYTDLHRWSIEHKELFWQELFSFYDIIHQGDTSVVTTSKTGFLNHSWFPQVELNFAENLLRHQSSEKIALNFQHESQIGRQMTYTQLAQEVGSIEAALKKIINKGDVVAAYLPNTCETVITMLATSALGGVFTSTSADFGVEGVADRFSQSRPKVLVAAANYNYDGKKFDLREKIQQIAQRLPFIEQIIIIDFLNTSPDISMIDKAITWDGLLQTPATPTFTPCQFSDPLYIMYSSGTTGKPKCIVHSVGGTLLMHLKELGLHSDHSESKSIFFFTTCGWMMWNWLVSSLAFGGTCVLYDGSPAHPSLNHFMEMINREKINIFGTSPKFIQALQKANYQGPGFPTLETILSTGAPLAPEQFDYIYQELGSNLMLSSICGGTDILGCFMLGNPLRPVHRGEIQSFGLGMDIACFNQDGEMVIEKEGELVCRHPFPSVPTGFLNDPDQNRFKDAYFNRFPGVWHHGDFVSLTARDTVKVFGRSDTTLNPGGVRIGTSEIYRQTDSFNYITDAVCVGKTLDGDVRIVLFLKMKEGEQLTPERIKEVKRRIRERTTPRHVPAEVATISDIPYTRSGKKMELAVTRLINGRELTNIEAIANPESLTEYKNYFADGAD